MNLAYAYQQSAKRTLLVDLDPQGAAGFYFRVSPSERFEAKEDDLSEDRLKGNIRESDYHGLDVLPSNLAYRKFDLLLDRMKKRRSQLRRLLEPLEEDYDRIILDCPPNITLLSENVFHASDGILVPVIPTTLSERTLEQLFQFFGAKELPEAVILPFFSMVQKRNRMHQENIEKLPERYPMFLKTVIPFTVEVERMGLHCKPLLAYAKGLPVCAALPGAFRGDRGEDESLRTLPGCLPPGISYRAGLRPESDSPGPSWAPDSDSFGYWQGCMQDIVLVVEDEADMVDLLRYHIIRAKLDSTFL